MSRTFELTTELEVEAPLEMYMTMSVATATLPDGRQLEIVSSGTSMFVWFPREDNGKGALRVKVPFGGVLDWIIEHEAELQAVHEEGQRIMDELHAQGGSINHERWKRAAGETTGVVAATT